MRLIVATKNNSKLKEIKKILNGIDIPIIALANLKKKFHIIENKPSFIENASKKAVSVSRIYKDDYVIGEDSGLEVDSLGGKPGVYSKRYSGKNSTDKKNNKKILTKLKMVSTKKRGASFHCALTLAKSGKVIKCFLGVLRGRISIREQGENGFGYDPIFYLESYKKTVAELTLAKKNIMSHRAKAFRKLRTYLIKNK